MKYEHYITDDAKRNAEQIDVIVHLYESYEHSWAKVSDALHTIGWSEEETTHALQDVQDHLSAT